MNLDLSWAASVVKAWAERQPAIYTVAFLGSRVKGTHRNDSDLDVAIGTDWTSMVCDSARWTTELEELLTFKPIRLVPLEDAVAGYVRESGIIVYERASETFDNVIFLPDDDPLWSQLHGGSGQDDPVGDLMPEWREQYDRMKRWQARLRESDVADERRLDDFHAFFVTCFHLKDWLKNAPTVDAAVGKRAEELINRPSMRVCADLANASKHLRLTKIRFTGDTRLEAAGAAFQADAFSGAFQTTGQIVIVGMGDNRWNALEVADGCVKHWEDFLRHEGLLA